MRRGRGGYRLDGDQVRAGVFGAPAARALGMEANHSARRAAPSGRQRYSPAVTSDRTFGAVRSPAAISTLSTACPMAA